MASEHDSTPGPFLRPASINDIGVLCRCKGLNVSVLLMLITPLLIVGPSYASADCEVEEVVELVNSRGFSKRMIEEACSGKVSNENCQLLEIVEMARRGINTDEIYRWCDLAGIGSMQLAHEVQVEPTSFKPHETVTVTVFVFTKDSVPLAGIRVRLEGEAVNMRAVADGIKVRPVTGIGHFQNGIGVIIGETNEQGTFQTTWECGGDCRDDFSYNIGIHLELPRFGVYFGSERLSMYTE